MKKSYKENYLTLISCNKHFKPKFFGATPFFVQYTERDVIMEYIQNNAYSLKFPLSGIHYISLVIFSKSYEYYKTLHKYIKCGTSECKKVIDIQFEIDESMIKNDRIEKLFEYGTISFYIRKMKDFLIVSHPRITINKDYLEEKI